MMFFILSKILGFVTEPMIHVAGLLILGGLFGRIRKMRRWQKPSFITAALLFFLYGTMPFAQLIARPLEHHYPVQRAADITDAQAIIVLGGFTSSGAISAETGQPQLGHAIERLTEALALHRQMPEIPLIISGFSGQLNHTGWSEDQITKKLLDQLGIDQRYIQFENQSRNTFENAVFSKEKLGPLNPDGRYILITSALHMPRAMGVFRAAGWPEMSPYPVDFKSLPNHIDWSFKPLKSHQMLKASFHEYLGIMVYWLTGRYA